MLKIFKLSNCSVSHWICTRIEEKILVNSCYFFSAVFVGCLCSVFWNRNLKFSRDRNLHVRNYFCNPCKKIRIRVWDINLQKCLLTYSLLRLALWSLQPSVFTKHVLNSSSPLSPLNNAPLPLRMANEPLYCFFQILMTSFPGYSSHKAQDKIHTEQTKTSLEKQPDQGAREYSFQAQLSTIF